MPVRVALKHVLLWSLVLGFGITVPLDLPARAPVSSHSVNGPSRAAAKGVLGGGIDLTIGLTRNGDGSTCGTETSISANVGDLIDFCYTVTNHSPVDLHYSSLVDSADGEVLSFQPTTIQAGNSFVYHHEVRAHTSSIHQTTWTAREDISRYAYDDASPLDFVDISATGQPLDIDGWGAEKEIESPFPFAMYGGAPTTRICVSNQGFIRTEVSSCYGQLVAVFENFQLPPYGSGELPFSEGNFIAPYWDLLDSVQGGVYWAVDGTAPNRRLVVQWDRPHIVFYGPTYTPAGSPGHLGVQAILSENGSIAFQYSKTTFDYVDFLGQPHPELDNGASATIGLSATAANGGDATLYSFNAVMPHPAPSSIHWVVNSPLAYSAQASVEVDVGGPLIAPSPTLVAAAAPSGSSAPVNATLEIANAGDRDLDWTLSEGTQAAGYRPVPHRPTPVAGESSAEPRTSARASAIASGAPTVEGQSVAPAGFTQCGSTIPGIVIHDDGVAINGYAGAANLNSVAVDKFTPTYYPATFTSVCVAFSTYAFPISPTGSVDYEVVVFDDTGPGGSPGNELGAVSATTTGTPYPAESNFLDSVDISSLGIAIVSGSVYIGVRWNPDQAPDYTVFLYADENGTDGTPPLYPPEGGYFDAGDGNFVPIVSLNTFSAYKALMVRAVESAPGCTDLADVPWIALSRVSGSVPVGGSPSTIDLTLDPTGLADGVHSANLCIESDYEIVAVPVQFSIGAVFPVANLQTSSLEFSLPQGESSQQTFTLANSGTSNSLLNYAITETAGDCTAPADVTWLTERPTQGTIPLGAPASIDVDVNASGISGGTHTATLCIATNDAGHALLTVSVTLTVNVPDSIFAGSFEPQPNPPAIYDSRDEFLTHVGPGFYEERFTDVPANVTILEPMTFTGGDGFAYGIYTQPGAASGLFNMPFVVSHNNSEDQIVITFATPVTAIGGNFWESNLYGEESGGPIWLTLSDGTFVPLGNTAQALTFRGLITDAPVTSLTIDSPNILAWAKLDNLIVGYKN